MRSLTIEDGELGVRIRVRKVIDGYEKHAIDEEWGNKWVEWVKMRTMRKRIVILLHYGRRI